MKRRSLSSVFLEFNTSHEKSQAKPRMTLKKLNLKAEKSNPPSGRESPSRTHRSKISFSARHTPNQSVLDVGRETQKAEPKLENFRFGTSQRASSVPRKTLPRLYTENLQRNVSEKLEQLKQKYGVLYKYMLKAHGINVEKEDLKEVMKKSKPIFDSTYSIKYFGVMNSEFGIASQRVPLQSILQENSAEKPPLIPSNREALSSKQNFNKDSGSISLGPSTWNNLDNFGTVGKEPSSPSEIIHVANQGPDYILEPKGSTAQQENYSPKLGRISKKVVIYPQGLGSTDSINDEVKYQLVPVNIKNPIRSTTEIDEKKSMNLDSNILSEVPRRQMSEVNLRKTHQPKQSMIEKQPEIRTVTTYALPKKLEGHKKRRQIEKDDSAKNVRANQVWVSVEPGPRDIPLLRNRNNGMVADQYPKEYVDELSIPERFRTHEIKALMSNRTNYSYSKLITTLYSKDRPEDILIENTRKIEEIRLKREEMKKAHLQKQKEKKVKGGEYKGSCSPENKILNDDGDSKLYALKGPFQIRITEPTINPLYSAFSKIRGKVENEGNV